jgi:hypothetical protein
MSVAVDLRPQKVDLYVFTGDSLTILLGLVDGSGNPLNLSSYTVSASAVKPDGTSVSFGVSEGSSGQVTLTLSPAVTLAMAGVWRWQLRTESAGGEVRHPVTGGLVVGVSARG